MSVAGWLATVHREARLAGEKREAQIGDRKRGKRLDKGTITGKKKSKKYGQTHKRAERKREKRMVYGQNCSVV